MKNILKIVVLSLVAAPVFGHAHDAKAAAPSAAPVVVKQEKNEFIKVPSLSFSGDVAFELALVDNKIKKHEEIQGVRMGMGRLFLNAKAEGESADGLIYSFNTRIFTNAENSKKNTAKDGSGVDIREAVTVFDRVWLEMKGRGFGTVHVGNYVGAYNLMIEDSSAIFGGNGGAMSGNWSAYFTLPYGVIKDYRQTADTRASTKISYYTPRFEGFQVGASYVPRSDYYGYVSSYEQKTLNASTAGQNIFGLGVNFAKEFSGTTFKLAAAGLKGTPVDKAGNTDTLEDVLSWEVSARVTSGPFDIAAGYMDNQKSMVKKASKFDAAKPETKLNFTDAGGIYASSSSYTLGSAKIALGGLWTSRTLLNDKKATLSAYSVTVDYTIEKGLYAYVDVTKLEGKTDDDLAKKANDNKEIGNSNSGYVGFIGLGVSF